MEKNHKTIILFQIVFLVVVVTGLYFFYPKVEQNVSGNIVKFHSGNSDFIIVSKSPDFSSPRFVNFEKEDDFPPESELEIIEFINKAKRIKLYQKHFSEIGEKCQKLLNLALDGYSIREITTILNFSSENYTKKRKTLCKESLFKKIYYDSQLKELLYGKLWDIRKIPRW